MSAIEPVLAGMYPDPSVCRVGADCYLVTSTFEYFPGVPIFHSRDLVRWHQIGHVLTRRSQLDLRGVASSRGIFAPTLRYCDGTFWMITTHVERGNFVVIAEDPAGPWSEPIWIDEQGIDPSLAFLDGRIYYTRTGRGSDADHPFIYQTELEWSEARDQLVATSEPRVIWKGTGGIWAEAPHLYRRGAHYYLLTAEGGTSYDHSVVVARSAQPYGPFTASPHGPLLTHRNAPDHPVQATGHADWVELEDGSTWAVLLGIRAAGGRHHHLGRETFVSSLRWDDDGWPRMGSGGLLEPREAPAGAGEAERDDFDSARLGPEWVFVRNPDSRDWSLGERPGHLRLWGSELTLSDAGSPALVCRRQGRFDAGVRTLVDFDPQQPGEQAGLCVRANEDFHLTLLIARVDGRRQLALSETLGGSTRTVAVCELGDGPVTLALRASRRHYTASGGTGANLRELGSVPVQSLSAETIRARTGRDSFTGVMLGLLATGMGRRSGAPADFDWFEYTAGPEK
jgi:xylan 1,4-beta-xylosidase